MFEEQKLNCLLDIDSGCSYIAKITQSMCLKNICDLLMSLVTQSVLLTERLGGYISLKCGIYFKMSLETVNGIT
jgi:hypothetical protein